MVNRLMTIEEQRAYERQRIEEVKKPVKSLDTLDQPVLPQEISPPVGVEMSGQVVDTTKYKYDRVKVRGPDGVARYTATCKDAVAKSMLGMSKDELFQVAKDNNLKMEEHFKLRNAGHFRMIVGQALRSQVTKGRAVTIRYIEIRALHQSVPWPPGYKEEAKGTTANPIRKQVSAHRIAD